MPRARFRQGSERITPTLVRAESRPSLNSDLLDKSQLIGRLFENVGASLAKTANLAQIPLPDHLKEIVALIVD